MFIGFCGFLYILNKKLCIVFDFILREFRFSVEGKYFYKDCLLGIIIGGVSMYINLFK